MSTLPPSSGTQKLWITSLLASARRTGRPTGTRSSLATRIVRPERRIDDSGSPTTTCRPMTRDHERVVGGARAGVRRARDAVDEQRHEHERPGRRCRRRSSTSAIGIARRRRRSASAARPSVSTAIAAAPTISTQATSVSAAASALAGARIDAGFIAASSQGEQVRGHVARVVARRAHVGHRGVGHQRPRRFDPARQRRRAVGHLAGDVAAPAEAGQRRAGRCRPRRAPRESRGSCRTGSGRAGAGPRSTLAPATCGVAAGRRACARRIRQAAASAMTHAIAAPKAREGEECRAPSRTNVKTILIVLAASAAFLLGAAAFVVYAGLYDISATKSHTQLGPLAARDDDASLGADARARHRGAAARRAGAAGTRRGLLSRPLRAVPWRAGCRARADGEEHAAAAGLADRRGAPLAPAGDLPDHPRRHQDERHAGLGACASTRTSCGRWSPSSSGCRRSRRPPTRARSKAPARIRASPAQAARVRRAR